MRPIYLLTAAAGFSVLTGCTTPSSTKSVATFAGGFEQTAKGVDGAFNTVSGLAIERALVSRGANYALHCGAAQTVADPCDLSFAPTQDPRTEAQLTIRRSIIRGLGAYAKALNALASSNARTDFNESVDALGGSLTSLTSNEVLGFTEAPQELGTFVSAVNIIGGFIIHQQINRAVSSVASDMHGSIKTIAETLSDDLDAFYQVSTSDVLIQEADLSALLLSPDLTSRDSIDRYDAYRRFASDFENRRIAAASVRRAKAALGGLVAAHDAIANPDAPEALAQAEQLVSLAEELVGLFEKGGPAVGMATLGAKP